MQDALEMRPQSRGREDPLEEGLATHSSVLAWRTPWTEEPGGLQFVRLQSQTQLKRLSLHSTSHQSVLNIVVSQIK